MNIHLYANFVSDITTLHKPELIGLELPGLHSGAPLKWRCCLFCALFFLRLNPNNLKVNLGLFFIFIMTHQFGHITPILTFYE
jgi:hypothetical protein